MKAFIDEYGNTDLEIEKDGVSSVFIITAILVNDDEEISLIKEIGKIADKHFNGSPIKSSNIGNNDKRRLEILSEVSKLPITIYTLIVDKSNLISEGFTYKKSFYKFLNGKLHFELYRDIPNLVIYHDSYGTNDFMLSFQKYIKEKCIHDLFNDADFYLLNSRDHRIIQLSDFICGCLARVYDNKKNKQYEKNYRSILTNIKGVIDEWPIVSRNKDEVDLINVEEDKKIEAITVHAINEYLGQYDESKIDEEKQRVYFLKYLFYYYKYFNKKDYIYTNEIRQHLSLNGIHVSDYHIRSRIVAPLRDEGIPISSSSQGYKIAICKSDVVRYIQHSKSIIGPMVRRMKKVRKTLLLGSNGQIDIYQNYGFPDEIKKDL
jgi:hypothetical protein